MSRFPRARDEGIVTEELGDELVVYDQATQTAHALSTDAASVWRRCDGQSSVKDIAHRVGLEQARVAQALDELSGAELIEEPDGISRRALYKHAAKLGAAAVSAPLIYSVAIRPASAQASSLCAFPSGNPCAVFWTNSTCSGPKESSNECGCLSGNCNGACDCQNVGGPCLPFGPVFARSGTCP
jgi:hypothetical protein